MSDRYQNLEIALNDLQERGVVNLRYLSIGCHSGIRDGKLLKLWLNRGQRHEAEYHGFDLFSHMTEELRQREFCKDLPPPSGKAALDNVNNILGPLCNRAETCVVGGDTQGLLPQWCIMAPEQDLILMDGGQSIETIYSDWTMAQRLMGFRTIVLFSHYHENRLDCGCQAIMEYIVREPGFKVTLLEPADSLSHTDLVTRMVRVELQ